MHPQKKLLQLCAEAQAFSNRALQNNVTEYRALTLGLKDIIQTLDDCCSAFCYSDVKSKNKFAPSVIKYINSGFPEKIRKDVQVLSTTAYELNKLKIELKGYDSITPAMAKEMWDILGIVYSYLIRRGWGDVRQAYIYRNEEGEYIARFTPQGIVVVESPEDAAIYFTKEVTCYIDSALKNLTGDSYSKVALTDVISLSCAKDYFGMEGDGDLSSRWVDAIAENGIEYNMITVNRFDSTAATKKHTVKRMKL